MRRTMGAIGATLAIVGVMAAFIASGVFDAMGTRPGGETISDAQPGTSPELEVSDDRSVLIGLPGLTQISPRTVPAETLTANRLPDDTSDIELRVIS